MSNLPIVKPDEIIKAIHYFDSHLRHTPEWTGWVSNESHKYAIFREFNIYPVKKIISIATGVQVSEFSGGNESNSYLQELGFKVISLRAYSWRILSGTTAIKTLDKSAFLHRGTGIPLEVRHFFIDGVLAAGESRKVNLVYKGQVFNAHVDMEVAGTARTRLFWNADFASVLHATFPQHYDAHVKEEDPASEAILTLERLNGFGSYAVAFAGDVAQLAEVVARFSEVQVPKDDGKWTDDELEAVVEAYLWMLDQEKKGLPYKKSEVNEGLRISKLAGRSKSSIEYRMQNISAVLDDLCLERIQGYLPAKNVGEKVKDRIKELLAKKKVIDPEDYQPTADEAILAKRVARIRSKKMVGVPKGQRKPQKIHSSGTSFARDPQVKAWVLENAAGICEACGEPAPFVSVDLMPFLEVHHVVPLAEGGPDVIENAVATCPNCHRRCHLSSDRMPFVESLHLKVNRLKKLLL